MLKVIRPSHNRQTQGYSRKHPGYDFSGRGDPNAYSSLFGQVVQAKNSETKNWLAGNRKLTTQDYGNYCKIRGEIDGKTYYQLLAHLEPGSVLPKGTEVKAGQVVGKIGHTGNSTAKHLHCEYRDEKDRNMPVQFVDEIESTIPMDNKQIIIDLYLGLRPNHPPSDDEINARLQENKNPVQIAQDILTGDDNAKSYWKETWGVKADSTNWKEVAKSYEDTYGALKGILSLPPAADTQRVHGEVLGLLELIKELKKASEVKTIYKHLGKDYEAIIKIGNLIIVLEKGGGKSGKTNS